MPAKDPQERSEHARLASYASWRETPDRTARTAPARHAAQAKQERLRVEAALKEREARARLGALQARRRLAEAVEVAHAAEQELVTLGLVLDE